MRTLLFATLGLACLLGCTPAGQNTSTTKKKAEEPAKPAGPPRPVFEAHSKGVAYVANSGEDTLSVFDLETLTAVPGSIRTGHQPGNLVRHPQQNTIFFPARFMSLDDIAKTTPEGGIQDIFRSGSLWAIDPNSGNSIRQKGVVGNPDDNPDAVFVTISQDGMWAAVSDWQNNKVYVRDQSDEERKRNAEITAGPGPFGIAFSPDGRYIAIAANDPNGTTDPDHVYLLDFLGNDQGPVEVARIPVGDRPSQIAAAPDNVSFYVTVSGSNKIVGVSAKTKGIIGEWGLDGQPQGIIADGAGAFYYATLQDKGEALRIDATTGQVSNRAKTGAEPYMLALDTHAGRLWVTNKGDDTVTVVSLGDFTPEKTLKTGKAPTGVVVVLNPTGAPPKADVGEPVQIETVPMSGAPTDQAVSIESGTVASDDAQ